MFNVFTDFHHAGLLNSLILLFEDRFKGKVFRPIGTKWHKMGFWAIHDHPATVEQYLGVGGATPDGSPRLNEVKERAFVDGGGLYYCHDIDSEKENRAITFEYFTNHPIDIVIASVPQHVEPFKRLCDLHVKKPLLIYQVGNEWNINEHKSLIDGVLSSAAPFKYSSAPGALAPSPNLV